MTSNQINGLKLKEMKNPLQRRVKLMMTRSPNLKKQVNFQLQFQGKMIKSFKELSSKG
jgi:hypothetical protein